ncbi:MAG: nucleoside triphosphate pyrophosphohydrolase [Clostridia bacterium]|nr:nucleoside triphosphate pyrophosphohydrolase [Clostridia bacterium]
MAVAFNKLVRDKIPDIIKAKGETPVTRILDDSEYRLRLEAKLTEEVAEYLESKELEELADILEVLYALAEAAGHSKEDLHNAQKAKNGSRGGFEKKILLISKE